jgi:hypothetical protein
MRFAVAARPKSSVRDMSFGLSRNNYLTVEILPQLGLYVEAVEFGRDFLRW